MDPNVVEDRIELGRRRGRVGDHRLVHLPAGAEDFPQIFGLEHPLLAAEHQITLPGHLHHLDFGELLDGLLAEQLAVAARSGRFQLYLQFDGPQLESQVALRGADLRKTRIRAIERCREINLPITLAMTVTPESLSSLWDAIEFGLGYPHVRGICSPTSRSAIARSATASTCVDFSTGR